MITKLEKMFIENMITNDFGEAPEHEIWTDCYHCGKHGAFVTTKVMRGVLSSLIQKGLVEADPGKDGGCWLTEEGQLLAQSW